MREFLAIICRKLVNSVGNGLQQLQDGLAHGPGSFIGLFDQKGQPGISLHQRNQYSRVIFANDRVQLPVSDTAAVYDDGRTLLNRLPVRELASTVIRAISFSAWLLVAQMCVQVTTGTLLFPRQTEVDLFRVPVLLQKSLDPFQSLSRCAFRTLRLAKHHGKTMRLLLAIPLQASVAPNLSTGREFRPF